MLNKIFTIMLGVLAFVLVFAVTASSVSAELCPDGLGGYWEDNDGDCIPKYFDNCWYMQNANQADSDGDCDEHDLPYTSDPHCGDVCDPVDDDDDGPYNHAPEIEQFYGQTVACDEEFDSVRLYVDDDHTDEEDLIVTAYSQYNRLDSDIRETNGHFYLVVDNPESGNDEPIVDYVRVKVKDKGGKYALSPWVKFKVLACEEDDDNIEDFVMDNIPGQTVQCYSSFSTKDFDDYIDNYGGYSSSELEFNIRSIQPQVDSEAGLDYKFYDSTNSFKVINPKDGRERTDRYEISVSAGASRLAQVTTGYFKVVNCDEEDDEDEPPEDEDELCSCTDYYNAYARYDGWNFMHWLHEHDECRGYYRVECPLPDDDDFNDWDCEDCDDDWDCDDCDWDDWDCDDCDNDEIHIHYYYDYYDDPYNYYYDNFYSQPIYIMDEPGCMLPDPYSARMVADKDCDNVPDNVDNCPEVHNPGQWDANRNGIGDSCEVVIESFSVLPGTDLKEGQAFTVSVSFANLAPEKLYNVQVEAAVDAFGLFGSELVDRMEIGETRTVTFRFNIPQCIDPRDAIVKVKVRYFEREVIGRNANLHISEGQCDLEVVHNSVVDVFDIQDVVVGESTSFPMLVENTANVDKSYVVTVQGVDSWGSYYVDGGNVVIVPAGQKKTVNLVVTARQDIDSGERVFMATLTQGYEIQEILLTANVKQKESESYGFTGGFVLALRIILVILLLALVVYAVFLAVKDKEMKSPVPRGYDPLPDFETYK
ncbi:hypothetical protein JW868_02430 [Candidatus Woesearchaeota archaeon]|nr:hypothetical protein [Candidatus Woesearchaeota archaeon]